MQVVHHSFRLDLEGVHQVGKRLAEEFEAGEILEVAKMLALVGEPAARESKDIFEMPADGEQRRRIKRQRHSQRNKASGAANQLRRAVDQRHHRVVAALQNFAVVHQKCIGNLSQPRQRLVVVDRDRLFAQVRAGHHQVRGRERSAKSKCCNGA